MTDQPERVSEAEIIELYALRNLALTHEKKGRAITAHALRKAADELEQLREQRRAVAAPDVDSSMEGDYAGLHYAEAELCPTLKGTGRRSRGAS